MSDTNAIFSKVDWKNDSNVLGFFERALNDRDTYNSDFDRQAEINIAWYRGHQLLRWNRNTNQLMTQPNPNHRVRLVVNLMRGLLDGFAAKLALDKIRLRAEPATDDVVDHDRAQLQSDLLRYYDEYLDMPSMVAKADHAAILTGESYVKVVWDAQKGSEFDNFTPEEFGMSKAEFDKEFGKELDEAQLRTGDICVSTIEPFNLFWGPPGVDFEDAEYVLEVYERSVASVMERYGLKRDEIVPGDRDDSSDGATRIWRPGQSNVYGSVSHERDEDMVLVKELWVRSNRAIKGLEQGRHCISISKKVVKNGPNPYRHQQIPIVKVDFLQIPGENRGDTFTTDMIPTQANINRTVSQFAENRELMANPTWLCRKGTIQNQHEWDSKPGGMREYSGEKPSLEQGAAMPNAVLVMLQHDLKFLQDIVGLRDVSQGKNPPGVRSGRGLALLKEADDERMGRIALRRRKFWTKVGRLMLQTLAQFVTEERVVRIRGDESASQTISYTGDMLGDQGQMGAEYFNITVESYGPPRSYSARRENLDLALERGALNPAQDPRDKAIVLDVLELGVARKDLDAKKKARAMQHYRNREMVKGNYIEPDIHEDLEVFLEELAAFRHEPFFPEIDHALFDRYEDQCIVLMAIKTIRPEMLVQQALASMGLLPPPEQQQNQPQPQLTTNTPA